jgi:hypothetical protein
MINQNNFIFPVEDFEIMWWMYVYKMKYYDYISKVLGNCESTSKYIETNLET